MQAQIIHAWGGAERFEAATLPDPTPGPGEVLVQVAATSVNPADYKLRQAGPPIAPELPAVLGCDVAGRVLAVGGGVAGFAEGDEVYGCVGGVRGMTGCYAEMIAADARLLAPKPASLTLREAAALPLVTITAWEGLARAGVRAYTSFFQLPLASSMQLSPTLPHPDPAIYLRSCLPNRNSAPILPGHPISYFRNSPIELHSLASLYDCLTFCSFFPKLHWRPQNLSDR